MSCVVVSISSTVQELHAELVFEADRRAIERPPLF